MANTVRIIGILLLVIPVILLLVGHWVPGLAVLPVGAAMTLWGGDHFSTMSSRRKPPSETDLYE
ncbi:MULTISPECIES: hypothetical protein [Kocuria]|uniref:hypothetical protein n=1 Tax=Kocuria TaxID=57493 RepID=UPI0006610777|nr:MULTISPECIES: hypothetical protein [Kocuria]MCT1367700.1 hypothetical protein [Rothia sp. p3-SID1597]RUQ20259.1 hypothetical protein D8M21_09800 [Kocuria sp. HSID16901]